VAVLELNELETAKLLQAVDLLVRGEVLLSHLDVGDPLTLAGRLGT
jgi:hypothetical protein